MSPPSAPKDKNELKNDLTNRILLFLPPFFSALFHPSRSPSFKNKDEWFKLINRFFFSSCIFSTTQFSIFVASHRSACSSNSCFYLQERWCSSLVVRRAAARLEFRRRWRAGGAEVRLIK